MNIGFVSTRFSGNDGVSLESAKWAEVLWNYHHVSYWYGGVLDRDPNICMLVPEAFFGHPANMEIENFVWTDYYRPRDITEKIQKLKQTLKDSLYTFVNKFNIDLLIVENAISIPMHIPLGIAITEFLSETGMPAIAHHHDFYWERPRFIITAVQDYLDMAFPPSLSNIQHVTISSVARNDLARRKGLASILVPNVYNFENPPEIDQTKIAELRHAMNIAPDDIMILQPTRIVPRKGIEHAITIVSRMHDSRNKLVVSHESGDEGDLYCAALREMAQSANVDLRFVNTYPSGHTPATSTKGKRFSLKEIYLCADLVTYPSLYEGFGNALLEAMYYKKPIVINRYTIWVADIAPKGFQVLSMEGLVTHRLVEDVRNILHDKDAREEMVNHNYKVATKHYSYTVLRRLLRILITNVTGMDSI